MTLPGDQWITPIQEAVDQGVPLVGANVTGLETALKTWVGQDEYNSGVILGGEMLKQLDAAGVTEGKIAVGICVAGGASSSGPRCGTAQGASKARNFRILERKKC